MSALTTSMFLNTSHTLYHTVLQMSLFLLTNTDVNTGHRLSPTISPSKQIKLSPNRSSNTAL